MVSLLGEKFDELVEEFTRRDEILVLVRRDVLGVRVFALYHRGAATQEPKHGSFERAAVSCVLGLALVHRSGLHSGQSNRKSPCSHFIQRSLPTLVVAVVMVVDVMEHDRR